MAARIAARYISRRLSSSGKGLSEVKAAGKLYKKVLNDLRKMEQEKLGGKGPPKPSETPAADGASPDLNWLSPYVLGGTTLIALVVWHVDSYASTKIMFTGLYVDLFLQSKNKSNGAAVAACGITFTHALSNYYRDLDSKMKTEEVEE